MSYLDEDKENVSFHKDGKLKLVLTSLYGGLHWVYTNSEGERLSVILHNGSYGGGEGFFEIMPSWRNPKKRGKSEGGDNVEGYLSFGDVQRWINELARRGKKEVKQK